MAEADKPYLPYGLKDYVILGEPERLDSFVLMRAQKQGNTPRLIFRSRENLVRNKSLMDQVLANSKAVSAAFSRALHVDHEVYPPTEGMPELFLVEIPGRSDTLDMVLNSGVQLPETIVGEYIYELLDGLGEFHQRGLVYGSIDPRFLFVEDDRGRKRIRLGGLFHVHPSGTDFPIGYSPEFSSPELADAGDISDETRDVYSVGMLAYRLLLPHATYKGQFANAFDATSPVDRSNAWRQYHREKYSSTTSFVALDTLNPQVSAPLAKIVHRMLNLAGKDRFASALEAKAELRNAIEETARWKARQKQIQEEGITNGRGAIPQVSVKARKGSGRPRWVMIAVGAVLVLALAGGGYYQFVHRPNVAAALARQEAFDAAVAAQRPVLAELVTLREELLSAVPLLAATNPAVDMLESAEQKYADLRQSAETTPMRLAADVEAMTAGIVSVRGDFDKVAEAVDASRLAADGARSSLGATLADLALLSPDENASLAALTAEAQGLDAAYSEGSFDDVAAAAKTLEDNALLEVAARSALKEEADAALNDLVTAIASFAGLSVEGSDVLAGFGGQADDVSAALEARRFEDANALALEGSAAVAAATGERSALRDRANAGLLSGEEQVAALSRRASVLSDAGSITDQIEGVQASLESVRSGIGLNDFERALSELSTVQAVSGQIADAIGALTLSGEQKLATLEQVLADLAAALPEGEAVDETLQAGAQAAASALERGDGVEAGRIADEVAVRAGAQLAAIVEQRSAAEALRRDTQAQLANAQATTPNLPGLDEAAANGMAADAAFEVRRYETAAAGYASILEFLGLSAESFGQQLAAFSDESALSIQNVDGLVAAGADAATVSQIADLLERARALAEAGDIDGARELLEQADLQSQAALQAVANLRARVNAASEQLNVLLADWQALEYRIADPAVETANQALATAGGAPTGVSWADALATLEKAGAELGPVVQAAQRLSQTVGQKRGRAVTQRQLALDTGSGESDLFLKADASFNEGEAALQNGLFEDSLAHFDMASLGFAEALDAVAALEEQVASLRDQLAARIGTAERIRALDENALAGHRELVAQPVENSSEAVADLIAGVAALDAAIARVEAGRADAEASKVAFESTFSEIEGLEAAESNEAVIALDGRAAESRDLFDAGIYLEAGPAYAALLTDADLLLAELQRPPRMSCDIEGLPAGMRYVPAGSYDISGAMALPRFRLGVGERLPSGAQEVSVARELCIMSEPLTRAQIADFVADLDPISLQKLPADVTQSPQNEQYVRGLSRDNVRQYASWLQELTGRTVRLPTLAELIAADGYPEDPEVFGGSELIWTDDMCQNSSFMAIVAKITGEMNSARAECRLITSSSYDDILVRFVVVGEGQDSQ